MSDDRLVVGHDGSAGADTALTTALGLAETLQSLVEVIRAWSVATAPRPANWTFGYVSSSEDLQGAVLDVLVTDVADIVSRHAGVAVSYRAVNGDAAASLTSCPAPHGWSWSARVGWAESPRCCSGRSVTRWSGGRTARSWSPRGR